MLPTMSKPFAIAVLGTTALLLSFLGNYRLVDESAALRRRLADQGYTYTLWETESVASEPEIVEEPPNVYLLDDGTLVVRHMLESVACSYFTALPNLSKRTEKVPTRIHYHFEECTDDHLGTQLAEYFGHYMLANAAQVPFTMTCGDGKEGGGDTVLRRLQTNNASPGLPPVDVTGHQYSVYDVCFACYGLSWWCDRGPELMLDTFHENMWRLANSNLGQTLEAEDAVVHLRLGDALMGGRDEGIGLLPFRAYSRLLRRAESELGPLATISVVTQTFEETAARPEDRLALARTELIAKEFVAHLRENFPNASVKLRNSPQDSPFVAYVRMVKANKVAICGFSKFCSYPVLANANIRYVFESEKFNLWVKRLRYTGLVRTMEAPRLTNNYIGSLTDNQVIHWLRHQDPNGNDIITGPPLFRVPKTKFIS